MPHPAETELSHRPLTRQDLLPHGPLVRVGRRVQLFDTLPSTNVYLREHALALGDGAVAAAEHQTSGRGRLGRVWESPRGASVLVSLLLIEPRRSPLLELGALLGAVAACEAIESATDVAPRVRWPNDLTVRGRKLGGILAESFPVGPPAGVPSGWGLAIGIGINCLQQRGHFRGHLADKATSLEIEGARGVARAAVARELLARLDHWLARTSCEAAAWDALRAAWHSRSDDPGARITLRHDGRAYEGTVLDIDAAGDLIVQLDQGGRRCFAAATTTREW